jgi:hypothetical protein
MAAVLLGIWAGLASASMLVGVGIGAFFFVQGQGANLTEKRQFDVNSRIGIALFAAGLAAAAIGHQPPFPTGFRMFYWVCLAIAGAGAMGLSYRPRT